MAPLVQFQMQLAKEKYKKARESMEFNLKTIAEDNYWFDDYYTGVKRLLIRKLFDPREPYITPAYVRDNNIFIIWILFVIKINIFVICFLFKVIKSLL